LGMVGVDAAGCGTEFNERESQGGGCVTSRWPDYVVRGDGGGVSGLR
jgi:hypothetical protein